MCPVSRRLPLPLLALQSLLLAVFTSWPLLPRMASEAVGSPETDTAKHLWTLWWMRAELYGGPLGMRTNLVNFPDGMDLYPISPVDGLIVALVPMPPVLAANVLALLHLVLLGVCAGWLGWETTRSRVGAHVTAAVAQGSSFAAFTLAVGVGELRLAWFLPLGLAVLVRARRTQRTGDFVRLGLVLAAAVFACFYHGLFLAVAVAALALATLRLRRRLLVGYTVAAGLSLAIVVPVVRGFASTYAEPAAASGERPLFPGASASLDELFWASAVVEPPPGVAPVYLAGRYLGVLVGVMGLLGLGARPRVARPWLFCFGVCAVLALGPMLRVHGEPVVLLGHTLGLPMGPLNTLLARVGEPLNFPARFLAPAGVALAVLCGVAASRWRALAWLVPVALLDVLHDQRTAWPRETLPAPELAGLEEAPGSGAVADLTALIYTNEGETRQLAIAAQALLRRPFSSVPVERLDRWWDSGARWLRAMRLVEVVTTFDHPDAYDTSIDWSGDVFLLRDRGFDAVLLTHRLRPHDTRAEDLLTRVLGEPVTSPHATLWPVPEVSVPVERAEALREAQDYAAAMFGRYRPPPTGPGNVKPRVPTSARGAGSVPVAQPPPSGPQGPPLGPDHPAHAAGRASPQ